MSVVENLRTFAAENAYDHTMARFDVGTSRTSRQETCMPSKTMCSFPFMPLIKEEKMLICIYKTTAVIEIWSNLFQRCLVNAAVIGRHGNLCEFN